MAKNIHVVIVHGIGKTSAGYSEPLARGITAQFNAYLQETLKSKDDFSSHLAVQEVIWDGVLAPNQDKLVAILKKGFENFEPKGFRAVLSKVFSFLTKPLLKLRADFAAQAISDILGYRNPEAYSRIHKCMTDGVERFVNVAMDPADKQHLSIICHSLGTVIASDFIYDRQKKFGHVHENFNFTNFFTLGSPIALFALQYGIELFRSPVVMENRAGQWINILFNSKKC